MNCKYSDINCENCKYKDECNIYKNYKEAVYDGMGEDA